MTTAVREAPHHRTLTCYVNYGCRLPECAERYREWNRNRTRAKRAGQWQPHVDAEPVRQHLRTLKEHGISIRQAATLAGVRGCSLHPLFHRPVRHTVRPEIAAAVLAIDPANTAPTYIDPTGTGRRIEALVADGWPMAHLADHIGVYHTYVHALTQRSHNGQKVRATTAAKVSDAFDRLATTKPARHGVNPKHFKQSRNMAASRQWPPTAYWADRMDVIDDPHFRPEYKKLRAEIIAEEAHWLITAGRLNREQAADRLGVSLFSIDRALREHPQDQMEVAA
ncbi:hypothetical protein ACIQNU_04010 [Streptomyces sp. NPDC091292]|uniref:hypothetical protein n=1 Tax=Streptomyces sp. NPDC091292 TaxID=3365991 RepID=UPI0037F2343C